MGRRKKRRVSIGRGEKKGGRKPQPEELRLVCPLGSETAARGDLGNVSRSCQACHDLCSECALAGI